jgi:hypothetical protein
MKYLVYEEKSHTQAEPLWHDIDSVAVTWNSHESMSKVAHAVLKWACLCIDNAGDNFEQLTA